MSSYYARCFKYTKRYLPTPIRPPPLPPRPRDAFVCARVALLSARLPTPLHWLSPSHPSTPARSTLRRRNPFYASPPPILRHSAATLTDATTPVPPCIHCILNCTPKRYVPMASIGMGAMQSVYDETAGFLPGKRINSLIFLSTPLSPVLLYFAYGNPTPSEGECGDYEPEADWRACAVPLETRFARVSFWGFLGRRRCGQGSARSGVAGSAGGALLGGVLLGGGRRTYKSGLPFGKILRCPPELGRGGADDVVLAGGQVTVMARCEEGESGAHSNFLYIALELCPAMLADLIEPPDRDTWRDIAVAFDPKRASRQIAGGLRHLHGLKLVHRDFKPQNILVSARAGGGGAKAYRMLISDFGLCKKLDVDQTLPADVARGDGGGGRWGGARRRYCAGM
ncbi:hypothetical protein B0H14DRAFT_3881024 [Mycena olivaceomarginata]|nr:hypothetical protein B0H14DRAFT_3881024 [Mycena olivaceomarginata]